MLVPYSSVKIVYGICGIGNGHLYRQLPTLDHLINGSAFVEVFTYGSSYEYLKNRFRELPKVTVHCVAVPYIIGNPKGLDFEKSAQDPRNQKDFFTINARIFADVDKRIGKPDLVISDYEPISAQYAYAHGAPLITIDQQSKFLLRGDWHPINGTSCIDEIMRLKLFFPRATQRIACSFFDVTPSKGSSENVTLIPPVMRPDVRAMGSSNKCCNSVLVYLSEQSPNDMQASELLKLLQEFPSWHFHLYCPAPDYQPIKTSSSNITIHSLRDNNFIHTLLSSSAIISTAGHSLLSEAMHLCIPVLCLPLSLFEQQINASVIADNNFGVSVAELSGSTVAHFLENASNFAHNIQEDKKVLIKGDGSSLVRESIRRLITL
jgi:uncharacterized protein (TIGR00661 family)